MKLKRAVLGIVAMTVLISLAGCNLLTDRQSLQSEESTDRQALQSEEFTDRPFTIKKTKIASNKIPYEAFQSEEFYEQYLKPLMLEVGFKEDNAYLKASEKKSKYVYYSDNSLVQTNYNSYGRFEIPNSRYVLGFQYQLTNLTDAKDFYSESKIYSDIGCGANSYYALFIILNKKNDTNDGDGAYSGAYGAETIFKDFASFGGFSGKGTYSGYDPTCYIFSQEHTTDEIYEKLREYFDNPDIKEKLLIEKQANLYD